jgi:hypothetical protein
MLTIYGTLRWRFQTTAILKGYSHSMEDLLERLVNCDSTSCRAATISQFIKRKQLHQAAMDTRFANSAQALAKAAELAGSDERILALSSLLRIGNLVKQWHDRTASLLGPALVNPLPPLAAATNPHDRYYVATFWRFVQPAWAREYLARSAVAEETAEKVRGECLEGMLALSSDLAGTIRSLIPPFESLDPRTEKRGDTKGRRLRRLLDGLGSVLVVSRKDLGTSVGEDFERLLQRGFDKSGVPLTESVLMELGESVFALTHEIVRTRFSTAVVSQTYAGIGVIHRWFRNANWDEFSAKSQSCAAVARDIVEALEILARTGLRKPVCQQRSGEEPTKTDIALDLYYL